jgi:hypothetical protein
MNVIVSSTQTTPPCHPQVPQRAPRRSLVSPRALRPHSRPVYLPLHPHSEAEQREVWRVRVRLVPLRVAGLVRRAVAGPRCR